MPRFVTEFLRFRKSRKLGQMVERTRGGHLGRGRNLRDDDYLLASAGRNIGWVRFAADSLEQAEDYILAGYHAYAGIGAARSSIDATATWLWRRLKIPVRARSHVSFTYDPFVQQVKTRMPAAEPTLDAFTALGREIEVHRNRSQHREGVALVRYRLPDGQWRWMLAPRGLQHPRDGDIVLRDLLREWADRSEAALRSLLEAI